MAQEFTIKSQQIENKINQLLPSQGGFQPGVDFSASTMVIPIVDLTETAEGSNLRQDLQSSFCINSTFNAVTGATTTIINTTGYFRLKGTYRSTNTTSNTSTIRITDGFSTTNLLSFASSVNGTFEDFDFLVFVNAGDSVAVASNANCVLNVVSRQIADVNGNLTNPS